MTHPLIMIALFVNIIYPSLLILTDANTFKIRRLIYDRLIKVTSNVSKHKVFVKPQTYHYHTIPCYIQHCVRQQQIKIKYSRNS